MFSTNNKTKTITITTILVIILVASVALTLVQAQDTDHGFAQQPGGGIPLPTGVTPDLTLPTIAHLNFRPDPVGQGQAFLVNIWTQPPLHVSRYHTGYEVTLTKPNGDVVVVGPLDSYRGDTSAYFEYIADEVGTWTIQFDFPGGYFPAGIYTRVDRYGLGDTDYTFDESVYYQASTDGPYEFEVQEEPVPSWPPAPLPTDYWTRPVSPENREWKSILGDFPWSGRGGGEDWPADTNTYASDYRFIPYVQGPQTSHVVWKRQDEVGGLIGGDLGETSFYTGGGFGRVQTLPTLIVGGKVYHTITKIIDGEPTDVWQCYDLRTGEVYWEQTGITRYPTYVAHTGGTYIAVPGAGAHMRGLGVDLIYIGGGRLIKYEPFNGEKIVDISIAPLSSSVIYKDPYALGVQNLGGGNYRLINWTIRESGRDLIDPFEDRIVSNISWPFSNLGDAQDFEAGVAVDTFAITPEATGVATNHFIVGADLETGQVLWNVTSDTGYGIFSTSTATADHGKFAVRFNDGHWYAWDLSNGHQVWQSEISSWPWGTFGCYSVESAYGLLYSMQFDGVVAYDWETGEIAWHYKHQIDNPYETPYQDNYPFFSQAWVADGVYYTFNNEHTISQPIYRGLRIHAINATTGEGIWNMTGYMQPGGISDGYLVAGSMYDGHVYVFGKGQSETTVTASPKVAADGGKVLIEGTVLDMSPGQHGTPAVSEETMTPQMEYLHMQKPLPTSAAGVPVVLSGIDSNGNHVEIGETVTNGYYGTFSFAWTPPGEGTFEIIASFVGDDSYGSSSAATAVTVGPAPTTDTEPEGEITHPIFSVEALIVIAVVVIAALAIIAYLVMRKPNR